MPRTLLLALLAGLLSLTSCADKNKNETKPPPPEARTDETYPPLDRMDTAPRSEPKTAPPTAMTQPPPIEPAPAEKPIKPSAGKSKATHDNTYVVQKGDTLSEISQKVYGDSGKWKKIYNANKNRIKDPNKLKVGTKLIIP